MDVGTVLSVAQTLFSSLQCSELKEVLSVFGYKSQFDELQHTVKTINAVLRDAETKQELSQQAQNWIDELKDAMFEADDLLDEFVTLAEQKQLLKADGSLSKKVSNFFSRSKNPLSVAYRMSRGIKDIKKKLDAIAYNSQFSFKIDHEPIRKRRPETCSYVNEVDIIGREDDLESIVGTLLDSNVRHDVSFLSIVGIGGLGKTALAQLVYNDPRVTDAFQLKMWTCVSDQDQKELDVKNILLKTLEKNCDDSTLDKVHNELREKLAYKKYLLVLDDVWTENHNQWRALASLLVGGQRGSWILVTTRSQQTSTIIGDGLMYKLQGLSDENSWLLFERTAFGLERSNPPEDLVIIGREIIGRCARVPLAIRVVGSLLYGQNKSTWLSFRDIGLANIRESLNGILPILKLSYHQLETPLKSCFSFCALFPKDFEINKKMLINIWMAQGYIVPLDEGQSIEDASEEYFSILLRRCFFQDVKEGNKGEITFKIHDLMHDIAQKVATREICSTNSSCGNLDKNVHHLFIAGSECGRYSFPKTHIRSIFFYGTLQHHISLDQVMVKAVVANCKWLRALHLSWSNIISLPESIGQLLHLRYLNLSENRKMMFLPKSITKLYNLQTLDLSGSCYLKELPKDLRKLVKLRVLDIEFCDELKFMPTGMGNLTCLHNLSDFIVGGEGSCSSWEQWFYGLDDLKSLCKLKGFLNIHIIWPKEAMNVLKQNVRREGLYLRGKEDLNHIVFNFTYEEASGRMDDEGTMKLMEDLQPHSNLTRLEVWGYEGAKLPSWITCLANLVQLHLRHCWNLEYLSWLGNLRHLKFLKLVKLAKLEYIEEDSLDEMLCLPALESLWLTSMPKLKGRRRVGVDNSKDKAQVLLFSPQLKSLRIDRCPQLICTLMCPRVEILHLTDINQRLQVEINTQSDDSLYAPCLKEVYISNVALLKSLPAEVFGCLERLTVYEDAEVESLEEVGEVFRGCSSSLRYLAIGYCHKLQSVVHGGLEHLTALEELHIFDCYSLRKLEEEEEERGGGNGIGILPWKPLQHSLHTLRFSDLPRLEKLPDGMQYLTSLQILRLCDCESVESIPTWMPKLTSLKLLRVWDCSESLYQGCQKVPPGQYWPYIQHIPVIQIGS